MNSFVRGLGTAVTLFSLAACQSSAPGIEQTVTPSSDPALNRVMAAFEDICIANAPTFEEGQVRRAFETSSLTVGAGTSILASSNPDGSCRVFLRGYGLERAKPTVGDQNKLARALQSRLGGELRPATLGASAAHSARLYVDGDRYTLYGSVDRGGDLTFSMYR